MSRRQAQTPVIDGFEFAKAGATMSGAWPVSNLPRLRNALHSDSGALEYDIRGAHDERGRPVLRIAVSGLLRLTCQRCLAGLDFRVQVASSLILAATPADMRGGPVDPDEPERVLASKEMVLRDLLEDELLLALPDAPRHEDCETAAGSGIGGVRESPFEGLRSMLDARAAGKKHSKDN